MGYVQKNMKFLKGKQNQLEFFKTYSDISKLRIIQVLDEEQKALELLKYIKFGNLKLVQEINEHFFKGERTFIEVADADRKNKKELYFLVDSKDDDEYSEVMYKKLEETLTARIKSEDSVITIGSRVNLIAQKLELNIIQHYDYALWENQNEFITKVSTLIEVGFKNGIFTDATLIVAQQNQDNRELVMKKLAPFEHDKKEEVYSSDWDVAMQEFQKTLSADIEIMKQNVSQEYLNYLSTIDVKKLYWIPNITFFKLKLIKAIIKQSVIELKIVEKIQRLKLELQLLDEKISKISDELTDVGRMINRVRREKETDSSIILFNAFKTRNAGPGILDEVRKKKDEDDILYKGKKSYKGGNK